MKKTLLSLLKASRLEVGVALGLVAAAGLLLFRLGSSPARMSGDELQTFTSNLRLHNLTRNPLNAPYKLIDYTLLHLVGSHIAAARLTSVGFALLANILFFVIMRRWHGRRTAWLATALFATSGWLLHVGRLGTANVMWLVLPLTFILLGSWVSRTERSGTVALVSALICGATIFVPAAIWFIAAYAFLLREDISHHWKSAEARQRTGAILIFLLCVGVLIFSLCRSPDLIRPWLGLPQSLPSVTGALKTWASSLLLYPFIRGPYAPEIWLAHTPILDMFTAIMFLMGAYFYITHFRNLRASMLAAFAVIGSVLTALNGPAAMSFLLPLAYLVAATGLTYLLHEWLTVFPRNPVARAVGVTLVIIAVASAATYHIASYFVAWQHNPVTAATFRDKP